MRWKRVVPAGQAAVWPPTVCELPAWAALAAFGTVPSLFRSMSVPLRVWVATLAPVMALLAILPVVTACDLI